VHPNDLYKEYHKMVTAVAKEYVRASKLGESYVEDLCQEAWVALADPKTLERLDLVDDDAQGAYVRKIAENTIARAIGVEVNQARRPDIEQLGVLGLETVRGLLNLLPSWRRTGEVPAHPDVAEPRTRRLVGMLAEISDAFDELDPDEQDLVLQVHESGPVPDWQALADRSGIGLAAVQKRYSRATLQIERRVNAQRRAAQSDWDQLGSTAAKIARGRGGE